MSTKPMRYLAALLAILLAGGCSGGTGGTGASNGGGTTSAVSSGQVTQLGSIYVNGVRFTTNGATITRDDVSINEIELRRGMVVEVRGSIDNNNTSGRAVTVSVEEAVRGPVESKSGSDAAGTLVVLGQTVQVDDTTLYDSSPGNFGSISTGNLLEIHGHRLADGTIQATYIEGKTGPVVYSVRGTVAGHNAAGGSFTMGALSVNYTTVPAIISDMPAPGVNNWNGLFVEVKGDTCAALPVCGTLTASKVEPEGLSTTDAVRAEVEGNVTARVSTSDFTIGSQRVVTTGSTIFSGGLQEDIVLGVKLEAEGSLVLGDLTASKISFRDNIRLEADIASIDTVAGTVTLDNLPGITVAVNAFTDFEGGANSLSEFSVGDHVRIRARVSSGTTVIASEFEERSADTRVILQGPVDSVSNPNVVILGVTVNTSTIADGSFKGLDDGAVGRNAFFAAIGAGSLVKARMDFNGSMVWEEIELED